MKKTRMIVKNAQPGLNLDKNSLIFNVIKIESPYPAMSPNGIIREDIEVEIPIKVLADLVNRLKSN